MVSREDEYRVVLRALPVADWDRYVAENSGLPGPRGNLGLIFAVAEEATPAVIRRSAASDDEYLAAMAVAPSTSRRGSQMAALDALDQVTESLAGVPMASRRGDDSFRVLRRALGYCWSVAVAALPDEGFPPLW